MQEAVRTNASRRGFFEGPGARQDPPAIASFKCASRPIWEQALVTSRGSIGNFVVLVLKRWKTCRWSLRTPTVDLARFPPPLHSCSPQALGPARPVLHGCPGGVPSRVEVTGKTLRPKPFSSTSIHQRLALVITAIWLGTISSTMPMPLRLQAAASSANSSGVPSFRVQPRMIDNVITMSATRSCRSDRGQVKVADTKLRQVRQCFPGGIEAK